MTNRREFLQAAAAVSAAPAVGQAAQAAGGWLPAAIELHAVIVDGRFEEARAFGARWSETGAAVRSIEADVTALWNDELRSVWARDPAAIAGLTARPALFLLERLAWDHRMRVVFHAEHSARPEGGFEHAILRGGAGLAAADIEAAGAVWPKALARALQGHPAPDRAHGPTSAGLARTLDEPAETLASWVIAPIRKA